MTTELPGLSSKVSQDITVRQPSNTNYIQNTGFFFNIQRLPSVQFFCQEVNLPAVNFDAIIQPTRFINVKHPAGKLNFENLEVTFIVDEDMANWREVFEWLKTIVPIEDTDDQISADDHYCDATLTLLNSAMNENLRVTFKNCFPTALSGLQFITTPGETEPQTATMTLTFDTYEIEKV